LAAGELVDTNHLMEMNAGTSMKKYAVARERVYILWMSSGIFNSTVHSLSSGNGEIFTISVLRILANFAAFAWQLLE
jgi:hypothetical protein